jgi:hypothetical protein
VVPANVVSPILQVGREIRIEFSMVLGASRLGQIQRRMRPQPALLPEQRVEDMRIVEQRAAENLLQVVRHGAVRR